MSSLIFSNQRKTKKLPTDHAASKQDILAFVFNQAEKNLANDDVLLGIGKSVTGDKKYLDTNIAPGPHQVQFQAALLTHAEPRNQPSYRNKL